MPERSRKMCTTTGSTACAAILCLVGAAVPAQAVAGPTPVAWQPAAPRQQRPWTR